jgi:hypothetical protein
MDRVTIGQAAHILGIEEESGSELRDRLEEARSIDDEEQRIVDKLETASEEEKSALVIKARELQERRKIWVEKVAQLIEESEDTHAASDAPDSRVDEWLEYARIAALDMEKKLFVMRTLVSTLAIGTIAVTLAIGTIVAISAVTPALLPKLNNLEGLWPAFGWLLISVAGSIIMCVYSMSQVSQLMARGSVGWSRGSNRSRLPDWASKLIRALPYTVLITFSAGALLIGIVSFALFISASIGYR